MDLLVIVYTLLFQIVKFNDGHILEAMAQAI